MIGRREVLIGLCVGLIAALVAYGETLASCELGTKELTTTSGQTNTQPDGSFLTEFSTDEKDFQACCGNIASESSQQTDGDICRYIETDDAFCEVAADNGVGIENATCPFQGPTEPDTCNHTMVINYELIAHNGETCCKTCECFGDPNCRSFDDSRDLWVVCDGRVTLEDEDGNPICRQKKRRCHKEEDHLGNTCVWQPDYLKEAGVDYDPEVHGSRCTSSFGGVNGLFGEDYPEMLMAEADGFSVTLSLGELGIIREVILKDEEGDSYSLTAKNCFASPDASAWDGSAAVPSDWKIVSEPGNPELTWKVNNDRTGIFLDIICQTVGGVARLNIANLIDSDDTREGQGFCYEGEITNKPGHSARSDVIHPICVSVFVSNYIEVCKALTGQVCNADNFDATVDAYCADFDFNRVTGISSSSDCADFLKTTDKDVVGQEWTRMVCEVNQLDVTNCMTMIDEDGWDTFLATNSDGLITGGNDAVTCATSIDQYTDEFDECERGVKVEYEVSEDVWEVAFFIPDNAPPCGGKLNIPVSMPELYTHRVRFVQCGLSAECLVRENACKPSPGFEVSVDYTEHCEPPPLVPTPEPTPPFEPPCSCEENPDEPTVICEGEDEYTELGNCDSCCINVENPDTIIEGECRSVETSVPYCNPEDENQQEKCEALPEGDGKLTIKFEYDGDTDELECCPSCQCWGDPQCRSFAGEYDVWLICESRNQACSSPKQSLCLNYNDHVGNQCVWDNVIASKVAAHRPDIGAYGSPCQPNWAVSGDAFMTMYEVEDFSLKLSMGERGVIETMVLKDSPENEYTLVADKCFQAVSFLDAWDITGPVNVDGAVEIKYKSELESERTYEVYDSVNEIYIQVACIRRVSKDGSQEGYRLNVENVIDMKFNRTDKGDGFCVTSQIDTLESTVDDELFKKCHEGGVGVTEVCQALWSKTCTKGSDLQRAVGEWCEEANVFRNVDNAALACTQYILETNQESKIIDRWVNQYCHAIYNGKLVGSQLASAVEQCESDVALGGLTEYVEEHGEGKYTDVCVSDPSVYTLRGDDECNSGISIETCPNSSGCTEEEWVQEFFIPEGKPPCNGMLEILAETHINLFTRKWRINQCYERDGENCSRAQKCNPVVGWTFSYKYEQDDSVCE